jgi:hypothetical protein
MIRRKQRREGGLKRKTAWRETNNDGKVLLIDGDLRRGHLPDYLWVAREAVLPTTLVVMLWQSLGFYRLSIR